MVEIKRHTRAMVIKAAKSTTITEGQVVALCAALDILERNYKTKGSWNKKPVRWDGVKFESLRAMANHIHAHPSTLSYYVNNDKPFGGCKIELI